MRTCETPIRATLVASYGSPKADVRQPGVPAPTPVPVAQTVGLLVRPSRGGLSSKTRRRHRRWRQADVRKARPRASAAAVLDRPSATPYLPQGFWHSRRLSANGQPDGLIGQWLKYFSAPRGQHMAKTKFRPLHDRVVVKRIDAEEKSKGGIIFPTLPKRSRRRVRLLRWAQVAATRPARSSSPTSRPATGCCSASGRAPRSSSTARNS